PARTLERCRKHVLCAECRPATSSDHTRVQNPILSIHLYALSPTARSAAAHALPSTRASRPPSWLQERCPIHERSGTALVCRRHAPALGTNERRRSACARFSGRAPAISSQPERTLPMIDTAIVRKPRWRRGRDTARPYPSSRGPPRGATVTAHPASG